MPPSSATSIVTVATGPSYVTRQWRYAVGSTWNDTAESALAMTPLFYTTVTRRQGFVARWSGEGLVARQAWPRGTARLARHPGYCGISTTGASRLLRHWEDQAGRRRVCDKLAGRVVE